MKYLPFIYSLFLLFSNVIAQPGANDTTFNTFDSGIYGDGSGFNNTVHDIVIQSDGKRIAVGTFTSFNGVSRNRIARLNVDGSLDNSFNPGAGFNWDVLTVVLQPDGKILVGGEFDEFNGVVRRSIARLNTDGSLDMTFNPIGNSGGFNFEVATIALQPDGKIVAGGVFSTFGGAPQGHIIRLNANGSPDSGFNVGTGFNDWVLSVVVQTDGKILVGGIFTSFNGTTKNRIARLEANGSLDASFNTGSAFNWNVKVIALQTDGKIVVGGDFAYFNGVGRNKIARLNGDGSLDLTFDPGTGFGSGGVTSIAIQPDGKIIVAGIFFLYNGFNPRYIIRLNPDASVDNSLITGNSFNATIYATTLQPDGKILVGGGFSSYNGIAKNRMIRLNCDGSADGIFNPGSGANKRINSCSIQADGKIIAGGNFTMFNGIVRNNITRINSDGSLDGTFYTGSGFDAEVLATSIQSDGKIIVGGSFTLYNGTARNRIIRLNNDGSLDVGFTVGTGFNAPVKSILIQSDGKILVGGDFTTYNGTTRIRIARLNADGSLDPTFSPGTGFNNTVSSIIVQSDGKIIVGGNFTSFNGTSLNRVARLNSNGSIDATLNSGTGFDMEVKSAAIQADGKVVIGGAFTSYNGLTVNRMIRLNTDGSADPAFLSGTGFNDTVWSIAIQPDGLILAGGNFTLFNGVARNRIARLNTNGSLNSVFNPGTGFNNQVRSISIQSDGKIIAAGDFTLFNALFKTRITRILADCPVINPGISVSNVTCVNGSDGVINLTPSGGFTPYSFIWNDGSSTEDRTNLNAGSYTTTISDGIGCSVNVNIIITEPVSTFAVTANVTHVSCYGGANGAIDLSLSGATLPYSFTWSSGVSTEDISGLLAGVYTVVVTDANGCTVVNDTINQPAAPLSCTTYSENVHCFGGADGVIYTSVSGGTAPYNFLWTGGQTSPDLSGLSAGSYSVSVSDSKGCVVTKAASVTQPALITHSFDVSTCYSYTWNAQVYNSSGTYTQNFTAFSGCDSVVTLHLHIQNATYGSLNQTACNSYTINGQTYTVSGSYVQYLSNAAGCDSVLTLNLTINNPTSSSLTLTACGSYTLNNETYASSGVYTQHLVNASGCDSSIVLNLTILSAPTVFLTQTACNEYTLNGQTYFSSGIYSQNLTGVNGCDSLLILDLHIHLTTSETITQTACDAYTLNGQTYTTSGVYTQNLTGIYGCDSILTLNLTISHPTTSFISTDACNSYTLNNQTYTESGTYVQNLTNSTGCDSTLTLNLTINPSPELTVSVNDSVLSASQTDAYQWINCATGELIADATTQLFIPGENGSYAVIGTSIQGCSDTSDCVDMDYYLTLTEKNKPEVSIVPNPTENFIIIRFQEEILNFTIRDVQGNVLQRKVIHSGEIVDLGQFADGVYMLELWNDEEALVKRVVKE